MNITDPKTRAQALLLGLAVGDALGVPVEFRPRGTFHVDGMTGFGAHKQPPGTWSDDTSLALCLAASIAEGFSMDDLARRFVRWERDAYMTAGGVVFDIGGATSAAISRLAAGTPWNEAGGSGVSDNGNGSLMRVAPLVFLTADEPVDVRLRYARAVSSITHAHPWSVAACFVYVEYLRKLLAGADKDAAYADLRADFRGATEPAGVDRLARALQGDIRALPAPAINSGGFVIDTFEAAFWCLLTTGSYREAVLAAVNLGGDTDTTGAVTGALAGLAYGLDAIPAEWRDTLARAGDIARLAADMAAACSAANRSAEHAQ